MIKQSILYVRNYHCSFCGDCWFRDNCTTSKNGRALNVNILLEEYKRVVRENLNSENGSKLRKKKSADVEPVFGMIKNNRYFKRFMLRGLEKKLILNKQKSMAYS